MARPKKAKAPQIFDYHDYRKYLRDWLEFSKSQATKHSLRSLARAAGLSPAYLSMILAGTRNFSLESLEQLIPILELTPQEEQHLRNLKVIADSENQEERMLALGALQRASGYRDNHSRELEAYRYLTNWYYVAIREAVNLPDFKADPHWIKDKLKFSVSIAEIQTALDFLIAHKFIVKNTRGNYELPQKQIDCFGGVYKIALSEFHKEMFGLASQSIDATPRQKRNITFHTMAIAEKNFEKLREILDSALVQVEKMGAAESTPDSVYHVTFACFPLTEEKA